MYPIIRCYTCNTSLGEFYDTYLAMKNQLYREHFAKELSNIDIFKLELDNVVNINTEEVFDILNIHNYCCRTRLMTNVEAISYLE